MLILALLAAACGGAPPVAPPATATVAALVVEVELPTATPDYDATPLPPVEAEGMTVAPARFWPMLIQVRWPLAS